ncbi:MAG TPA: sodium:calcium antiporter [Usitatibacter sp.]|nr:sodium:calcium antiporter [Usitatibacter sp.]
MSAAVLAWGAFLGCAAAIAVGGTALCRLADEIAETTGLTRTWIGLVLLAVATSLPELVTGLSSVRLAQAPDIAMGDALGSVVFNLALLGGVYLSGGGMPRAATGRDTRSAALSAAYGIGLLAIAGVALGMNGTPSVGAVSLHSLLLLLLYAVAMRHLYARGARPAAASAPRGQAMSPFVRFGAAAIAVGAAASALPFVARHLAVLMGWTDSAVGTLLVAAATSLPELAVTGAAVRIGRPELAVGNLLGSNLFDMAIVAVDDLFFAPGPLFAFVSADHARSIASGLVMSGLALLGPRRAVGAALCAAYAANAWLAWRGAG